MNLLSKTIDFIKVRYKIHTLPHIIYPYRSTFITINKGDKIEGLSELVLQAKLYRNQSEAFALQSLQAKNDSEVILTQAEAAALLSTEQATLSASARNESLTAQLASENAADNSEQFAQNAANIVASITNQIDLTPTLNNVLRGNGTLFESVSDVELLRRKESFARSWSGALMNSKNIYAWDSFNRANTISGPNGLGQLDSGQTWEGVFSGNNLRILNKYALLSSFNLALIPIQGGVNQRIVFGGATVIGNNRSIIAVFLQDNNNYLRFRYNTFQIWIQKVVNGVVTNLATSSFGSPASVLENRNIDFIDCKVFRLGGSALLQMNIQGFITPNIQFVTSDTEVLSIIDNMTKAGISGEIPTLGINNFVAQSLTNL